MRTISAGRIEVGSYISILKQVVYRDVQNPLSGEINRDYIEDNCPWYKGIPFKVIDVNLPIIAVDTQNLWQPQLARVMFFDTRFTTFLEVNEAFYNTYYNLITKKEQKTNP